MLVRQRRLAAVILAALVFGLLGTSLLLAGDRDSPADQLKDRQRADRQRVERTEMFLSDQQSPQRSQRLAATSCVGGLAGIYPCNNIDLMTFMPLSSIGGGNGNDIWGWTDPMTGREYALMGRTSGTSFIDITDPENPIYLGNLPPQTSNSSWRDIKVYANHAYIVSEAASHGMQIFDLTQLRTVVAPPATFVNTAFYDNFGSAHNIVINEDTGFAYAVGTATCSGGLHFIDLADPIMPVFAGCHVETVYTHDAQCVVYNGPDLDHQGREICINSNENRITLVDVTDHSNPTVISTTTYSGTGYTHQGWLTEDQTYYMQGDELDEQNFAHNTRTRIYNMADLDNPVLIGTYDSTTAAIDHNLYTLNGYIYQANYRAGLRVFDLADVASGTLSEVAQFDIYPSSNSANFNGAWSVYPYFASGNVIISGIEQGLFIVRMQLDPDFLASASPGEISICSPTDADIAIDLTVRNGYSGDVTLSAVGLPAGAVANFSVNPVATPNGSTMTFSPNTVAAGSYPFQVEATDGTITRSIPISALIADIIPAAPQPDQPADGTIDTARAPNFSWLGTPQALTYQLEIATDSGFTSVVYDAVVSSVSHIPNMLLQPETTYFWHVSADNACGAGVDSPTFEFTTRPVPDLLLVDDDDNGPDVRDTYTAALDTLGVPYDIWDTGNSDDEPSAAALALYKQVIWFTGDEFGGAAGPGGGGESALASWLDDSNCLMLSSQDYYFDRNLTGFMQSHLGVSTATSDVAQATAEGVGSLYAGFGTFTLAYPYTNWSDDVVPDGTAEGAFIGSTNLSAVSKDSGVYRTTFLSFGVEALPTATDQQAALADFLAWCGVLPSLDPDSDGATNADDCAPGDSDIWSEPGESRDLLLTVAGVDNLKWQPPLDPGATVVTYDVLRADGASGFETATCLASGVNGLTATDAGIPTADQAYYYLIRSRNGCGESLGHQRNQPGVTCP